MALSNVQLTPQLVQAVRDAVDIVDIASEHTRLQKAGKRYKGLCPLHKEKTPSFSVEPVQGLYYCFGCGQGGDAIDLYMRLSGDDFPSAVETLARRYGIALPTRKEGRGGSAGRDLEAVLEMAASFFCERLAASEKPRRYLEQRRIAPELVERFGLGYAPDGWRNLLEAVRGKVRPEDLEAAGLTARSQKSDEPYDRFRNRLMFPIRVASGRLVGFGGRTLGDDKAKYINTAETERFKKGWLLYGLDQAKRPIREGGRALLVEGYFDLLGAAAAGIDWVVASMGTALTGEQARLLARYADEVYVGYDGDDAGERAFRRALPLLLAEGLAVRRPRFGAEHDPDSLRLEEGDQALRNAVEESSDAVLLELERSAPPEAAAEPQRQAAAARAVAELLRPIPDAVLRYGYARRAADRIGVPVELLWRRLGGAEPAAGERAADLPRQSPVRSLEERVLQLLLAGDEPPPPAEELPDEGAFLNPDCRNIFRAFMRIYAVGERPEVRAVLGALSEGGASVDRMAQLLLESSVASREGELSERLAQLQGRWKRQRLRELSAEIAAAQRSGDGGLLDQLIREKTALSRDLHRR